jgi:hypothetical protein
VSITERSYDPCWLVFEVYDHHQPATGTGIPPVEALTVGTFVRLTMVRRRNRAQDRIDVGCHLGVADVRIQDVVVPGVGEYDNADLVRGRDFANDWSLSHANARSTASASWSLG